MRIYRLFIIDFIVIFICLILANFPKTYYIDIYKYSVFYNNIYLNFNEIDKKNEYEKIFGKISESISKNKFTFFSLQKLNENNELNSFFSDNKISMFENNNIRSIIRIYSFNKIQNDELNKYISDDIIKNINRFKELSNINDWYFNIELWQNNIMISQQDLNSKYIDKNLLNLSKINLGLKTPFYCVITSTLSESEYGYNKCSTQNTDFEYEDQHIKINILKLIIIFLFTIYLSSTLIYRILRWKVGYIKKEKN